MMTGTLTGWSFSFDQYVDHQIGTPISSLSIAAGAAMNEVPSPTATIATVHASAISREVQARRNEGIVLMGKSSTIARPGLSRDPPYAHAPWRG